MKNKTAVNDVILLTLVGGCVLFSTGYFLPDHMSLPGATLVSGLIAHVIFIRVSVWNIEEKVYKGLLALGVTLLMSLCASLLLVASCYIFSKLPLCMENRRNAFIILDFFFPFLIVSVSWAARRWSRSRDF